MPTLSYSEVNSGLLVALRCRRLSLCRLRRLSLLQETVPSEALRGHCR